MQLTILIVEDEEVHRELIKHSIEKYNSNSPDIKFVIVGEAHSYANAINIISREDENITLVLLDIKLLDKHKTGLDIMLRFPNLSYAIISNDVLASAKAINNLSNPNIYFFQNKEEGFPDVADVINGLDKFVGDKRKRGELFSKKIRVKGNDILVKKIIFISKDLLHLKDNKILTHCEICEDPKKDLIHIYSNSTETIKYGNSNHKHLAIIESVSHSIVHVIEDFQLDPEDFIVISQSTVINLNFIDRFFRKAFELSVNIVDHGNHAFANIPGVESRLNKGNVIDKIDRHLP